MGSIQTAHTKPYRNHHAKNMQNHLAQPNRLTFAIDEETLNPSSINKSRDYTDFLHAVVLRSYQSENLVYRASWTNSLARPNFEQSAYRMELNSEDDGEATLGNPELDPYQSMNLDASVEFYNEN